MRKSFNTMGGTFFDFFLNVRIHSDSSARVKVSARFESVNHRLALSDLIFEIST